MSSFIVSDRTINDIVGLIDNPFSYGYLKDELRNLTDKYGYTLNREITDTTMDEIAADLMRMNLEAVNTRYGDSGGVKQDRAQLKYAYDPYSNIYQQLKSMHCLRYQASEGDVPNTATYKFLSDMIHITERYIIDNLPQYKNAGWDTWDSPQVKVERMV